MAMMFRNINSYFLSAYDVDSMDLRTLKELCYSFKHADRYPKMIEIFGDVPRFHTLFEADSQAVNFYFEEAYYYLGFIHVLIQNFKRLDPSRIPLNTRMAYAKSILAFAYGYRDLDSAMMFGVELIDLFEQEVETFEEKLLFHEIAVLISRMLVEAGMPHGTQFLYQALMFFATENVENHQSEAYLLFGDAKLLKNEPNEALEAYKRGFNEATHDDDVENIILAYLKIAQLLANYDDKDSAMKLFEEALSVFNSRIALKTPILIHIKGIVGDYYLDHEKMVDEAIENYKTAIELVKSTSKLQTRKDISVFYKKIIAACQQKKDSEGAMEYQRRLDELNEFYANLKKYEGTS
jgi:tetratricopeptide (TPR) repeat protein